MTTPFFLLLTTISIVGVTTLMYTFVYRVKLPPEVYEELDDMAKMARRSTKKAMRREFEVDRNVRKKGVQLTLGESDQGEKVTINMADEPCIFIGGTSGAGKTNLINNILLSVADWSRSVNIYIISTFKGVKFKNFQDLVAQKVTVALEEHLWYSSLEAITKEMEDREKLIAGASASNNTIEDIQSYNKAFVRNPLPYTLFVVDEASALLKGDKKQKTLDLLLPLVKRGRSSGIYGIVASQYLSAKEMTGELLGIMPCRIALRTSSPQVSKLLLHAKGAEALNPKEGEAIITSTVHNNVKFKNALITPQGVERSVKKINRKYGYLA